MSEKILYFLTVNLQSNALKICEEFFVEIKEWCLCKKNTLENAGGLATAAIFEFTSV